MALDDLNPDALVALGQAIRKKRRALGWTQQHLASESGHNEKDLRKLERGELTKIIVITNVCQALQLSVDIYLTATARSNTSIADKQYGSYNRSHYKSYSGSYLAFRRSLTVPENFLRTVFDIDWSDERRCLTFRENHCYVASDGKTIDFSQAGDIYINNNIGLFHLVTSTDGALRLITLSKMRTHDDALGGVVLTQLRNTLYYSPAVSPIYLQKCKAVSDCQKLDAIIGPISPMHELYSTVAIYIEEVERNVAYFPPTASLDGKVTRISSRILNSR